MKQLFYILIFFFISLNAFSTDYTTSGSGGSWTNSGTWNNTPYPSNISDNAILSNTDSVWVDGVGSLTGCDVLTFNQNSILFVSSNDTRLQNWNYGWNAIYFVTICTKNREYYFGNIADKKMQLSEIGKIAKKYWNEIPKHFPFVELNEFVVMPNHIHGIIIINKPDDGRNNVVETHNYVETHNHASLQTTKPKNKFGPQSKNLASIIRGFKSAVTINARKTNACFAWQSRFHDHIIRNDVSFQRIRNYICENPAKWMDDKFYNNG